MSVVPQSEHKWSEIENLRKETHNRSISNQPPDPSASKRIDELLQELADAGDVDAKVQKCVREAEKEFAAGFMTRCEGFARLMECVANAANEVPLPGDEHFPARRGTGDYDWLKEMRLLFLQLALAYLMSKGDRDDFNEMLKDNHLSGIGGVPKGGYDITYEESWVVTHSDGGSGSGFMPPLSDDNSDPHGRKAHFLANAYLTFVYGLAGDLGRFVWSFTEDSSTDNLMNKVGAQFGHELATGKITPDNVADWIRKKVCAEPMTKLSLYGISQESKTVPDGTYHHYEFHLYGPQNIEEIWMEWVKITWERSHIAFTLGTYEIPVAVSKLENELTTSVKRKEFAREYLRQEGFSVGQSPP